MTISLIIITGLTAVRGQKQKPLPADAVTDRMFSYAPSSVRIEGYLGEKMDLVISKRIKAQDADHLIEPFRHKEETRLWQSEFWGKWIQSAIAAYNYNHDPELLRIIEGAVAGLLETQMPDGYIGNYSDEAALQHWDIWGRKYTLLGLIAYYDLTSDKNVLRAAVRLTDHLLTQVGRGKADIVKTGNYRGMPSSSVLEPVVYLYRRTGDNKYLEFAKYIVGQWETPDGPLLISAAIKGIPVSERFPHPSSWWSYENGQKAYEMMSCYEGLLELYRVTGEANYLKAVESAVKNIISTEINLAGSGSAFECWYRGIEHQTEPTYHTMETCVTMTWMKLCFSLLRLTGNPEYADQIEISAYNALMASLKYDGMEIAKYSPLGGIRHAGEEQCGMHINCCNANGPRAFMMLPSFAVTGAAGEVFINLYGTGSAVVPLEKKNNMLIEQSSGYPVTDSIGFVISPDKPVELSLGFRIPSWSRNTDVEVNGIKIKDIRPGTYAMVSRTWSKGDRVIIKMDLSARLMKQNGHQAIIRGPVVLARDTRFGDGFIAEPAVIPEKEGIVGLVPVKEKPDHVWMAFRADLVLGTDLEGEFRQPRPVSFCDFASAGNTWNEDSRYRVWIPQTLNVMNEEYKSY
ncbi:MAG: beta-L-arabinofuranosidase domain-containing protein [Bacteroidales bacterium]